MAEAAEAVCCSANRRMAAAREPAARPGCCCSMKPSRPPSMAPRTLLDVNLVCSRLLKISQIHHDSLSSWQQSKLAPGAGMLSQVPRTRHRAYGHVDHVCNLCRFKTGFSALMVAHVTSRRRLTSTLANWGCDGDPLRIRQKDSSFGCLRSVSGPMQLR